MGTLGIGVIGAGKHGLRYARHLTEVDGARLVAICRRDRRAGEATAAAHGCAYHADWRALIEDPRVDAIAAVVPPVLNVAIVEAACRAAKPVLIEKPLATTLAGARRIAETVDGARVPAMVAQTLRWDATVAAVRAQLEAIGPLHALTLIQRFEPSPLPWLDRLAESGGGIVLHTGVHSIDLLRVLSGREITELSCVTTRVLTRETEDNFTALARLGADGPLAHIAGSRALGARTGLIELSGAGGHILADHVHREAWSVRGADRTPMAIPSAVATVREALRAFVAGVRDGAPMPVTIEDGVRTIAVVDACYRSAARGGAPERVEAP